MPATAHIEQVRMGATRRRSSKLIRPRFRTRNTKGLKGPKAKTLKPKGTRKFREGPHVHDSVLQVPAGEAAQEEEGTAGEIDALGSEKSQVPTYGFGVGAISLFPTWRVRPQCNPSFPRLIITYA